MACRESWLSVETQFGAPGQGAKLPFSPPRLSVGLLEQPQIINRVASRPENFPSITHSFACFETSYKEYFAALLSFVVNSGGRWRNPLIHLSGNALTPFPAPKNAPRTTPPKSDLRRYNEPCPSGKYRTTSRPLQGQRPNDRRHLIPWFYLPSYR